MILIIAEKPVLGRAIADAIPGQGKSEDGCITKGNYTIAWAYGHLLTLKDPEDYDPAYKVWSLDALPIYFPDWGKKPGQSDGKGISKADRLCQIAELLEKADQVIHAGDPDDEGQYLIDEILQWCNYRGPVYRMNTNDTTPAALKKALEHLEPNENMVNIGWSAHARSVADILVGYNCSRYFSLKNPEVLLTVGRVQTATLGLVVQRDSLIENHVKQKYYEVYGDVAIDGKVVTAKYEPAATTDSSFDADGRIIEEAYAKSKAGLLTHEQLGPIEVTERKGEEAPPLPFNLTELQSYCSSHFGYDPTQVLSITQSLRDNYNAITYNRSDCRYLSDEQYKEAPSTIRAVIANTGLNPQGLDMTLHAKCFNSAKITAHTAIIPQNNKVDISALSAAEKNVYLAICKYYLLQFLPPAEKIYTKLKVRLSDGASLTASSTGITKHGFLIFLTSGSVKSKEERDNEPEKETRTVLSNIAPGTYSGSIVDSRCEEKETKPPARYTKASLGKDMTCVSKYVKDPYVKKLLLAKDKDKDGENGSIGTVATRPYIIDKLVDRGYLTEDNRKLISTPLGRELFRILPDGLKYPDMTGYWWAIQDDIAKGSRKWTDLTDSVLSEIDTIIHTEYPKVDMTLIPPHLKRNINGRKVRQPLGKCPLCGSDVIEGKIGFGCSGYKAGCKFVVWKTSKYGLLQKTEIKPADISKWLCSEWKPEEESGKKTGKLITTKAVKFKKLYSPKKDTTFEGSLYLRVNPETGAVDTKYIFTPRKSK